MERTEPTTDSQVLLDQGEELLDSSRKLLQSMDDALSGSGPDQGDSD